MGLFFSAPRKSTPPSGSHASLASSEHERDQRHGDSAANDEHFAESAHSSRRISPLELRKQVRYDLHDKLGRSKGEAVYNTLLAHASDREYSLGSSRGVSGREIKDMLHTLKNNHQDNLRDHEVEHVEAVLRKHFDD